LCRPRASIIDPKQGQPAEALICIALGVFPDLNPALHPSDGRGPGRTSGKRPDNARTTGPMGSQSPKPVIYVVDDDDAVRDSLDAYLTLKGMSVLAFGSAQEVLDGSEFNASLMILDVNMPDMDGFVLLDALRNRGHTAPAVLITGLGDPEVRARADRAGVAAFFDKPIDTIAMFSTITRLLGGLDGPAA
jgi:CheY-like chemotaxis protein